MAELSKTSERLDLPAEDRARLEKERRALAKVLGGKTWVKKLQLSEEELLEDAILLNDIDASLRIAAKEHGVDDCQQLVKGVMAVPFKTRTGRIVKAFEDCSCTKNWKLANSFKERYLIRHFPDAMFNLRFEKDVSANKFRTKAIAYMKRIIDGEERRGLYLHGYLGVGKTFMVTAMTNEMALQGKTIAHVLVPQLVNDVRMSFKEVTNSAEQTLLENLKKADVLVLDDIGSEQVFPWFRDERLFPVLDYRMQNQKTTIFTSNFSVEELYAIYGKDEKIKAARLVDRIKTLAPSAQLEGQNFRY